MSNVSRTICIPIIASLSARMVKSDYGVPGSPVFYEADDMTVDSIEIFGRDYTLKEIAEK